MFSVALILKPLPHVQITEEEILAPLAAIKASFDTDRPPRLRVRVKSYAKGRLSVAISDGGQPAQRKLIQLNTASLSHDEMLQAATTTIGEVVAAFTTPMLRAGLRKHMGALFWPMRASIVQWVSMSLYGYMANCMAGHERPGFEKSQPTMGRRNGRTSRV